MKRHDEKLKSIGSVGKLFRRLLRASMGFQKSVSLQERDVHAGVLRNNCYEYQKEIKTALLEAERKKAEAIEWQRRKIIC